MNIREVGSEEDLTSAAEELANLLGGPEPTDDEDTSEADPAPDGDAPDEDQASEEQAKSEPELPAIAPPNSWDAEAKEKFKALPRDMQELVSRREAERDRATQYKLQEAAEARRAIDARAHEAAQMRQQYETRLVQLARHLESTIPPEFANIRNASDLVRLADTNPALVAKFQAWQAQATHIASELAAVEQQRQYEQAQSFQGHLAQEFERIAEKWPEFVDPVKGDTVRQELTSYAKERGFEQHEIDSLADHRLALVLRDAVEGRKAIAALAKARGKVDARPLPKVVAPGSGEQTGRGITDRAGALRVAKSGNLGSIQAQLEKMLSR